MYNFFFQLFSPKLLGMFIFLVNCFLRHHLFPVTNISELIRVPFQKLPTVPFFSPFSSTHSHSYPLSFFYWCLPASPPHHTSFLVIEFPNKLRLRDGINLFTFVLFEGKKLRRKQLRKMATKKKKKIPTLLRARKKDTEN